MSNLSSYRLRTERDVITRVTRLLKGAGRFNVSVGGEVTPDEILGSSIISAGFRTLDLQAALSVSGREVGKYLQRQIGQRIYKGELLARRKRGFLAGEKLVIAPTDGVLDFLNEKTGELKISFLPKKMDLPAGVFGIVEKVDNERGLVVMRTQVSIIHGLFGTGKLCDGTLHILAKNDDLIGSNLIQPESEDHILVGGSLFLKETITSAISNGVSGIITGGINAGDYKGMAGGRLSFPRNFDFDIGVSVVVCEGFGSIPIGDDIFTVLQEFEGKFVFLDGNKSQIFLPSPSKSSMGKVRSTKLPPLESNIQTKDGSQTNFLDLKPGFKVRVIGNSYTGEQGKIIALNDSVTMMASGIKAIMATIETKRRKIQLPVANLEIIG